MNRILCFFNIFLICVILFLPGCGKKIETGSPEEVLSRIKDKGGTDEVLRFYTGDTIKYLEKYMKLTGGPREAAADILGFISPDAEYEVYDKNFSGDTCILKLRFTKQKSENLNGLVLEIKMVKESGNWKIDRSEDFKKLVKSFEDRGAENYLNSIR